MSGIALLKFEDFVNPLTFFRLPYLQFYSP